MSSEEVEEEAGASADTDAQVWANNEPEENIELVEANEEGDENQDFVVSFEDLCVHVPESGWKCCTCIDSPLKNFGHEYLGMSVEERASFYILDRVSGCVRAGETCLVLGKSGSGKSTLLRALCGRLNETDELYGTLSLNGIPLGKSNQAWRCMSNYVSASDATHSPILTVEETFRFAAHCTSDGSGNNEEIERRVQAMLQALGLAHVGQTVVGDENIRGVSGGQKRRVTVGEMVMNLNAQFFCLDNITDGLASTDSLSLIEKIAAVCKKDNIAAVCTLLQPSDEIIQLFDKLLVLSSDGQTSYFGPVDRRLLRGIFLGEEGDSEEDDSGGIADLVMNQSATDMCLSSSTSQVDEAAQRFLKSSLYDHLMKDLASIRASAPHIRDRESMLMALLPNKKFSASRFYQLKVIARRRLKLIFRNSMTYARVFIAAVFGVIVGSLFSALQQDIIGALGRSGFIFLSSFLVLMLSAAVTIPDGFRQRITLFKHRDAEFYSGRVAYFVQVFLDMPLSIVEATVIALISYFWVDMHRGANHFFFFLGTLIALECVGQAFGRVLCALSRTQVSANTASSLCILLFATVGGFMPAYDQVTWALRWLSWLTPVSYAFEAMMLNEFDGRSFYGLVIVDSNGTSTIGHFRGVDYLSGQSLPRVQWGTNTQIKLFDLFMLFIFAFVLDNIGMFYQEHTRAWYYNQIRRPQAKVRRDAVEDEKSASAINRAVSIATGKKFDVEGSQMENETSDGSSEPESLSVKNLRYSVPLGKSRRCTIESIIGPFLMRCAGSKMSVEEDTQQDELILLNDVTARFRRGQMTALMGQSGAGKTTLMDVIAGYKTGGRITGDIMIDGFPKLVSTWKQINGYAEQNDILNPYMSVLETLEFTAACRLPSHVNKKEIIANVIELMGLEAYAGMVVGREKEGEGLPKHARKRLTIANQLVALPKILFLDEPTSGLGVNAAALVIGAVRRSTDALGLITLATIHQPSRKMFESFDDLLLLAKGGRIAYMGELGPKSETLISHFASLSKEDPPDYFNPADFVLGVLDKGSANDAVSVYRDSTHCKNVLSAIEMDVEKANKSDTPGLRYTADTPAKCFFTEFATEFGLLFQRQFLVQWRNPSYSFMRMTVSAGATFMLGLLFFDIQKNVQGAVFAIAAIFFLTFVLVIPMQAAVIPLIEDRAVLYREAVSGTYSRLTYGLGQLFADIPFHILNTVIMFAIIYYLVGFRTGPEYVGYFILMLFLANWSVMSLGQLYAAVTPNEETANGLAGLSVILSVCLMGFLITSSAMPSGWLWAYWMNMFRYILQGLVTNEIGGQEYHVDIGKLIPNITKSESAINEGGVRWLAEPESYTGTAIAFLSGTIPSGNNTAAQAARLMGLTIEAGDGMNTPDSFGDLADLVDCMVSNQCLADPILQNFLSCNVFGVFSPPPCVDEFNKVVNSIDGVGEIAKCFIDQDFQSEGSDVSADNAAGGVPTSFSTEGFSRLTSSSQENLISCFMRVILPVGEGRGIRAISNIFGDLFDIVMWIVDIVEKGINIPGDAILFYFGWSVFDNESFSFSSPFKWHYCITATAIFLVSIQIIKLLAVRFIVWTKR